MSLNHQGNENQTHNDMAPDSSKNGYYQRLSLKAGEDMEKGEPLHTAGKHVN
jgi:hypothetical protein